MAGIIYEFMDGLKNETSLYDKLFELAAEKKSHIIKGDIPKINEVNGKEESVVMRLKAYEKLRNQLMKDIASILNIKQDSVTITQIEEAIKNQPEEAKELSEIKDSLSKSLERLKTINDENMLLINQSLEYAQFSINVLQSSLNGPEVTSNYGNEDNKRGGSFFDAKQ